MKTPMEGLEQFLVTSRWMERQVEIHLNTSWRNFGKAVINAEYDITSPLKFARVIINSGHVRYHNELNAKLEPLITELQMNVHTPWEGYRNLTSSFVYNLQDAEKSALLVFDNGDYKNGNSFGLKLNCYCKLVQL